MSRRRSDPFTVVMANLSSLSLANLEHVQRELNALIPAAREIEAAQAANGARGADVPPISGGSQMAGFRGYCEERMIRRGDHLCGPYLYDRYWVRDESKAKGWRLTSKYMGRKPTEE